MQDGEYRAVKALSQSALKRFLVSPAHYQDYINSPVEVTDEMTMGTAVHLASFQIQHFHNEVIQSPKFDRRKPAEREAALRFQHENAGKICLDQDDYEKCIDISESVRSHPIIAKYLDKGKPEVSIFADTNYSGVKFKGRLDLVCEPCGVIIDLKTIGKEASLYNCKKQIRDLSYDIQAYCYLELMKSIYPDRPFKFMFAFVEKKKPYGVRIVEINPLSLQERYLTVNEAFQSFDKCLTENVWSGYPAKVNIIEV